MQVVLTALASSFLSVNQPPSAGVASIEHKIMPAKSSEASRHQLPDQVNKESSQKLLDAQNDTIQKLRNTIKEQKRKIAELENTVGRLNDHHFTLFMQRENMMRQIKHQELQIEVRNKQNLQLMREKLELRQTSDANIKILTQRVQELEGLVFNLRQNSPYLQGPILPPLPPILPFVEDSTQFPQPVQMQEATGHELTEREFMSEWNDAADISDESLRQKVQDFVGMKSTRNESDQDHVDSCCLDGQEAVQSVISSIIADVITAIEENDKQKKELEREAKRKAKKEKILRERAERKAQAEAEASQAAEKRDVEKALRQAQQETDAKAKRDAQNALKAEQEALARRAAEAEAARQMRIERKRLAEEKRIAQEEAAEKARKEAEFQREQEQLEAERQARELRRKQGKQPKVRKDACLHEGSKEKGAKVEGPNPSKVHGNGVEQAIKVMNTGYLTNPNTVQVAVLPLTQTVVSSVKTDERAGHWRKFLDVCTNVFQPTSASTETDFRCKNLPDEISHILIVQLLLDVRVKDMFEIIKDDALYFVTLTCRRISDAPDFDSPSVSLAQISIWFEDARITTAYQEFLRNMQMDEAEVSFDVLTLVSGLCKDWLDRIQTAFPGLFGKYQIKELRGMVDQYYSPKYQVLLNGNTDASKQEFIVLSGLEILDWICRGRLVQ